MLCHPDAKRKDLRLLFVFFRIDGHSLETNSLKEAAQTEKALNRGTIQRLRTVLADGFG